VVTKRGRGRPPKVKVEQSPIARPRGRPRKLIPEQSQEDFVESEPIPNGIVSSDSNGPAEEVIEIKVENVSYNTDDEGFDIIALSPNPEAVTTRQATTPVNLFKPNFEEEIEAEGADKNLETETVPEEVNVEPPSKKCKTDEPAALNETIVETFANQLKSNGGHESIIDELEMD
jgi:hypothetical protein